VNQALPARVSVRIGESGAKMGGASAMADDRTYSFAPGIFRRERVFHLGQNELRWEDGRHSRSLAYADVESVHIYNMFQAYGFETQVCTLRTRAGVRSDLQSKSFRPWGRSEDRSSQYDPFVRDLLGRVCSAAPQARFFAGLPTATYYGQAVALAFFALLIVAGLAPMIGDSITGSYDTGAFIAIMLILIPPAIGAAKTLFRGSPRRLDPKGLPDDLIGPKHSPQP
jgi:hypothetical protein